MEKYSEVLRLIPKCFSRENREETHVESEERKLELRLGPPGEYKRQLYHGAKRGYEDTIHDTKTGEKNWLINSFLEKKPFDERILMSQKQTPTPRGLDMYSPQMSYSRPSVGIGNSSANTVAVPNISQKRIALAPVVGWPPIRSSRKNLATKQAHESSNKIPEERGDRKPEILGNSLFVKINMDGVPIGRKVDLKAYDSYEKLSSAVDKLFRGLLAAQAETSDGLNRNENGDKGIMGLLDGSGKYTLVYEDGDGDRMLVGDVPWHMFVSSAKRLRVLKKSELSAIQLSNTKLERTPLESATKRQGDEMRNV